ncbi:MAG: hypothetical protein ACJAUH_000875 [Saprospiraceae bacterium]|jgi:hypothetical protein
MGYIKLHHFYNSLRELFISFSFAKIKLHVTHMVQIHGRDFATLRNRQ